MSDLMFDSLHRGLGKVLDLRASQHALTAANLANAETPGFKAKFIPFDRVLAEALGQGDELEMRRTDPVHLLMADPDSPPVEEIEAPPWAVDGNSVNAEREATRLAENALMYDAVATGLSKRLAMMRYAASDGKSA